MACERRLIVKSYIRAYGPSGTAALYISIEATVVHMNLVNLKPMCNRYIHHNMALGSIP